MALLTDGLKSHKLHSSALAWCVDFCCYFGTGRLSGGAASPSGMNSMAAAFCKTSALGSIAELGVGRVGLQAGLGQHAGCQLQVLNSMGVQWCRDLRRCASADVCITGSSVQQSFVMLAHFAAARSNLLAAGNISARLTMQYRLPVGLGPSLKTWSIHIY